VEAGDEETGGMACDGGLTCHFGVWKGQDCQDVAKHKTKFGLIPNKTPNKTEGKA